MSSQAPVEYETRTEMTVGVLGSIVLAAVADLLLAGLQRAVTPWARRRAAP